jgi:hypothetical protein
MSSVGAPLVERDILEELAFFKAESKDLVEQIYHFDTRLTIRKKQPDIVAQKGPATRAMKRSARVKLAQPFMLLPISYSRRRTH